MTKEGEAFYDELDQDKRKPGSCGCLALGIIFLIILLIVEFSIFSFGHSLRSSANLEQASRINSSVDGDFSVIAGADDKSEIVIQESILCSKIVTSIKSKDGVTCLINSDGLTIAGKVNFITPSNASSLLVPRISNGRLVFDSKESKIGKLNVPAFVSGGFGKIVSKVINNSIPDSKNIELTGVSTQEAIMILQVKKINK
jgi:hypothetical protein